MATATYEAVNASSRSVRTSQARACSSQAIDVTEVWKQASSYSA